MQTEITPSDFPHIAGRVRVLSEAFWDHRWRPFKIEYVTYAEAIRHPVRTGDVNHELSRYDLDIAYHMGAN